MDIAEVRCDKCIYFEWDETDGGIDVCYSTKANYGVRQYDCLGSLKLLLVRPDFGCRFFEAKPRE